MSLNLFELRELAHSSSSLTDSTYGGSGGVGFDPAWAVAGDMMDNGSIDFSGGFLAGGMLGGIFDY